jgi:hypothetical protein
MISDYISQISDHSINVKNMTLPLFLRTGTALLDIDKCMDCATATNQVGPNSTPESAGQGAPDESPSRSKKDPITEQSTRRRFASRRRYKPIAEPADRIFRELLQNHSRDPNARRYPKDTMMGTLSLRYFPISLGGCT